MLQQNFTEPKTQHDVLCEQLTEFTIVSIISGLTEACFWLFVSQGHMDEDVQAALLQIIRMRQEFVCWSFLIQNPTYCRFTIFTTPHPPPPPLQQSVPAVAPVGAHCVCVFVLGKNFSKQAALKSIL